MNRKVFVLVLMGALLLIAGCNLARLRTGPTQTESQSVEPGGAESVDVTINMGVGELEVSGGADNLLDAEFTYNVEDWRPQVNYNVSGNRGELTISQPESDIEGIPDGSVRNEWRLRLNNAIPMSLNANLGVGTSNLDLSGLTLTGLVVRTGVGETTIDLSGDWQQGFDVNIEGGVGATTVRLPRDVGVQVTTSTGIGNVTVNDLNRDGDTYTNDAYDAGADVVLEVTVEGGVGEITLELGD